MILFLLPILLSTRVMLSSLFQRAHHVYGYDLSLIFRAVINRSKWDTMIYYCNSSQDRKAFLAIQFRQECNQHCYGLHLGN